MDTVWWNEPSYENVLRFAVCFLIGTSSCLLGGFLNFESYVLLRFAGYGNLEAQGLWFFVKRVYYVVSMIALSLFNVRRLKQCSIFRFSASLSGALLLQTVYLCFCHDPFGHRWVLAFLFFFVSFYSSCLFASFVILCFNMDEKSKITLMMRHMLYFLIGTCLSSYLPRLLLSRRIVSRTLAAARLEGIYTITRHYSAVCTVIAFLTASVISIFYQTESGQHYNALLEMSNEVGFRYFWDVSVIGNTFLCSIGWALSHVCGFAISSFILSVPLSSGLWLVNAYSHVITGIVCFCLFVFYIRDLSSDSDEDWETNDTGLAEGCSPNDRSYLTMVEKKRCFDNRIAKISSSCNFRQPQPWYLLPHGFWSIWEKEDNDLFSCLSVLVTVARCVALTRPSTTSSYDECDSEVKNPTVTNDDITTAKHHLLSAITSFTTKCNIISKNLEGEFIESLPKECPMKALQKKMDAFCKKCKCIKSTWDKHDSADCVDCIYAVNSAASAASILASFHCGSTESSISTEGVTTNDKVAEVTPTMPTVTVAASPSGSPTPIKNVMQFPSQKTLSPAMKSIVEAIKCMVDICVTNVSPLTEVINDSAELDYNKPEFSLSAAGDVLDGSMVVVLVMRTRLCAIEELILLLKCMGGLESTILKVVSKYSTDYVCNPCNVDKLDPKAVCGCSCLLMLCKCYAVLHEIQCSAPTIILQLSIGFESGIIGLSTIRCLILLISCYIQVMRSSVSSDDGNCLCKKENKTCNCCKYSHQLYEILSRWYHDTVRSNNTGDTLLGDAITLLSTILRNSKKSTAKPEDLTALWTNVNYSSEKLDMVDQLLNRPVPISRNFNALSQYIESNKINVPNRCMWCSKKHKGDECKCLYKHIYENGLVDRCTMEIVKGVSNLFGIKENENLSTCFDKMSNCLKDLTEKLEKLCPASTTGKIECINDICSELKTFFRSFSDVQKSNNRKAFCKEQSDNKAILGLLLYNCTIGECHGESTMSTGKSCSNPCCKSLACIISQITKHINGSSEESSPNPVQCTNEDTTGYMGKCIYNKPISTLISECNCSLSMLMNMCSDEKGKETDNRNSISSKLKSLCCKITDVKEQMCSLRECLSWLNCEYNNYCMKLSEVEGVLKERYSKQCETICKLQHYMDENGETYNKAIEDIKDIVKQISQLSAKHGVAVNYIDGNIAKLVNAINQTCDRLNNVDKTLAKCLSGMDAEKRSLLLPITQELVKRVGKKYTPMISLSDWLRVFDVVWLLAVIFCFVWSLYIITRDEWLHITSRMFSILLAIKSAVTLNSCFFGIAHCKKDRERLTMLSIIFGFFIAFCMSYVSQWWTHILYYRQHVKPIVEWFRVINPSYLYAQTTKFYQNHSALLSIFYGDVGYIKHFLSWNGNCFSYNPFGSLLDNKLYVHNIGLNFVGICKSNAFKRSLRNDVIQKAIGGDYYSLLDYITLASLKVKDLGFMFSVPIGNIEKLPFDLIWTAWNLHEVLTPERCLGYGLAESGYLNATYIDESGMSGEKTENFYIEPCNLMGSMALCIPRDTNIVLNKHNASQLVHIYKSYILQELLSQPPKEKSTPQDDPHDIRDTVDQWIAKRLYTCDTVYGGSDFCKSAVKRTVDLLGKYHTTVSDQMNSNFPKDFIRFCDSYSKHRSVRSIWADEVLYPDNGEETRHGNALTDGNDSSVMDFDITESNLDSKDYRPATTSRIHPNRFILGYWLKDSGISLSSLETANVLAVMARYNRL
ncbi:putative integral membrane protein [Babesia bovis T2Bo]|uniref:Uncharacterized protein n=1 Tax=Babesia bovis TaxID=5865 RepID=A7ATZ5_BABBO|nr:putative integral membrane protein [Babesia bovis T2Bo]EDO06406.1 putative integral membrane protein [Babesia bovis T2Bo]|eukprot:XP_001609974.1 hypothetical protein [Babesia bovis T2Bo]